jgi:hypothetical protein
MDLPSHENKQPCNLKRLQTEDIMRQPQREEGHMLFMGYLFSILSFVFSNVFGESVFPIIKLNIVTSLSWVEVITIRPKACDSSYI